MDSPAVSVIIPCYNAEKYLDMCMESILNQTLRDIEIICVDDGSTDKTLNKLNYYAANNPRMRVFSQRNQFAGAARNLGLSQARGEYVLFLDCDDFFAENLAQDAYAAAVSADADVVLFNARCFDEATGEFQKGWFLNMGLVPEKRPFSPEECADHLYQSTSPVPWTKMFRRQFLLDTKLQFQTLRHTNDFYFVLSGLAMAKRIVAIDQVLVTYRIGQKTNLTGADITPRTKKIIEASASAAVSMGHGYIGTEHLLLAMADEGDCFAVNLMNELGASSADIPRF